VDQDFIRRVHEGFGAFDAGDFTAAVSNFAPDIEWDFSALPGEGVVRGRDALRTYFEGVGQVWAEMTNDIEEIEETDQGNLIVDARLRARGLRSGVDVDTPVAYVWEMRDGEVVRVRLYFDRGEARRAAAEAEGV
jgi:ketosteroid isomerase-like protein